MTWARRLWPAAVFQISFVGSLALLKPGANALVISRFSVAALPWLYLAVAAATAALAWWNVRAKGARPSPGRLALFGALCVAASVAALRSGVAWAAPATWLLGELFGTWVAIAFWARIGDAFDAREARGAFTVINGIGMSGSIAGGLAAQVLARALGAQALAWVGAALLGLGALAWRFHRSALEAPAPRTTRSQGQALQAFRGSRYVQVLGLLVLAFSLLSALSDYLFRHRAHSLGEADMAALFGSLQLWTGVFSVLFQLFLAEWLLRQLGILRYLACVPLLFAVLAVATWADADLWPAYALKLLEGAAAYSLLPVGVQLLYAPLPDTQRDGVRGIIDGFLRKGGLAVAGTLLLVFGRLADGSQLSWAIAGLGVGAALLIFAMRPGYLAALHERVAGAADDGIAGLEARLLFDALRSPAPERALRALEMMQAAGMPVTPHVRGLLLHPHEKVQERGVQLAVLLSVRTCQKELEALLRGSDRRPRYEAAWALARLHPARAREVLPGLLEAPDVGVRCAAIGALTALGVDAARSALQRVLDHGAAAPVAERREVARLLGRLHDPVWEEPLARYLADGDATVRRVAIAAVGQGDYVALAPRLLRFLTWRDERRAVREALTALGDDVVPLVDQVLDDRSRALSVRLQLPRVLRQIGTQAAFDALLFSNARDDPFLHHQTGTALIRLRDARPDLVADAARVKEALGRRKDTYLRLLEPYRVARAGVGDRALLTRALGDRLDQSLELSFWLLGLRHDARALRRAHAHLVGGDPRRRAWALELLENVLEPEERALVQEMTEKHHRAVEPGEAGGLPAVLEALCRSDDARLRAVARTVARARGLWNEAYREDDMSEITVRRLFALEGVEIFSQCDVDDLAAIAQVAREQSFRAGDRVYAEGDPGDAVYVVLEGRAESRRDGELVLEVREKEAFGDVSLFDGSPRVTDVIAVTPLKVLVIDRRDFLDLLADRPELLAGVFRVLSRQLQKVVIQLAESRATTGEAPVVRDPTAPAPPADKSKPPV